MKKTISTAVAVSKNKPIYVFLILTIVISVLSLSVLLILPSIITMANAQTSSFSTTSSNVGDSGIDDKQQMGVCIVGVRSHCNGDR